MVKLPLLASQMVLEGIRDGEAFASRDPLGVGGPRG